VGIEDPKLRRRLDELRSACANGTLQIEQTITERTFDAAIPPLEVDLGSLPHITLGSAEDSGITATSPDALRDLEEIGVLGEGGMGRILLARQASLNRDVAVKTLRAGASRADVLALVREARVAGALEHPSIVPVHALGLNKDGQPLLVMKRVEGVSWRRLLTDADHPAWMTHLGVKRATLEANIVVLTAVCRALELAHARGIIHRDVKPDNVMIGAYGEVYLVDWGIATTRGADPELDAIVGTPAYLAPEMVRCEPVDERTDVYLLGATLHRILTGSTRHSGRDVMATIVRALHSEPATYGSGVPAILGDLCNEACAASAQERPSSVRAFRERLVAFERYRSALAICDVAEERLSRLSALLSESASAAPKDLALAYRLATEARFGFAQSLEQYPEHEEARRGAQRCVEATAELELRQGHAETAAALVEEVPVLAASFAPRFEAAREMAVESAREHDRLRALDHDQDPSVGRRARLATLAGLIALEVVVVSIIKARDPAGAPTQTTLVLVMVVMIVISVIAGVVIRRQLLTNAFSFRTGALLLLVELATFANRVIGSARSTPVVTIVEIDLLLVASIAGTGAVLFVPRLAVVSAVVLAGLAMIESDPSRAWIVFPVAVLVGFIVTGWAVWTHPRPGPR
jgi:eukaryotic-like serine/threonine-protein kinase